MTVTTDTPVGFIGLGIMGAAMALGSNPWHIMDSPYDRDEELIGDLLEADAAVCPWHGFDFELATGLCRVNPDLSVPVYAVRVANGMVEVDLP